MFEGKQGHSWTSYLIKRESRRYGQCTEVLVVVHAALIKAARRNRPIRTRVRKTILMTEVTEQHVGEVHGSTVARVEVTLEVPLVRGMNHILPGNWSSAVR
jgi:hypothetical protein